MRPVQLTAILVVFAAASPSVAIDPGLPLSPLEDGWLRVEADPSTVFRWSVEDPCQSCVDGNPEASGGIDAGRRPFSPCQRECAGRAELHIEVQPTQVIDLELGPPAGVTLVGVYPHRRSLVALFTAEFRNSAMGAGGPVDNTFQWWSAVRLAPDPTVLEHRQIISSSSDCHGLSASSQKLMIRPVFETDEEAVWLRVEATPWICYGGRGDTWLVRWPVGEQPSCAAAPSSGFETPFVLRPGGFTEVGTFAQTEVGIGRMLVSAFEFPAGLALALQIHGSRDPTFVRLPQFDVTHQLAGYPERWSLAPGPSRDLRSDPLQADGLWIAATEWPEVAVPCAATWPSGVFDRFSRITWQPLVSDELEEIGLLSMPCQPWREWPPLPGPNSSWLLRIGRGWPSPLFVVDSCGEFANIDRYQPPRVPVTVSDNGRSVRLEYQPFADPDWLSPGRQARDPAGSVASLASQLSAAKVKGGVRAIRLSLGGSVAVEPTRTRWVETWSGEDDFVDLEWTGEMFLATTRRGQIVSSLDGSDWRAGVAVRSPGPGRPSGGSQASTDAAARRSARIQRIVAGVCPGLKDPPGGVVGAASDGKTLVVVTPDCTVSRTTSCTEWTGERPQECHLAYDVAWVQGTYLLVGQGPNKSDAGRLWSSEDAVTWLLEPVPLGDELTRLASSERTIVIAGYRRLLEASIYSKTEASSR